jgi:hypothetical protein
VVGLQQLVALVDMGVGMGVVMAGGDGVVVVIECEGGCCHRWWWSLQKGVGAEFEQMTKIECENGCKNDHFCKSEGRVQFFGSFSSQF